MTMSLAPLLNASSVGPVYAFAMGVFALAGVRLTVPSDTKTTLDKSLYRDVIARRGWALNGDVPRD
jgi:hypothetical protein